MNSNIKAGIYKKNAKYVKWGIIWCVAAGLSYGFGSTLQTFANMEEPFATLSAMSLLMVPLIIASMQDYLSAITVILKNWQAGKHKEYIRSLVTKPARNFVLASVFGGPIALGCFCASILYCGPVYSVIIIAISPATGALLSRIVLKEHISLRGWCGIALCILGPVLVSWAPEAAAQYPNFYLGIILAAIATLGWAGELVVSTAGMDFIDPEVAICIRFTYSGTFSLIVVPIVALTSGIGVIESLGYYFTSIPTMSALWLIPSGIICGFSYLFYYKGANSAGAARAIAINPLFTVTATIMGIFVWNTELAWNFFAGLILLLAGGMLVVGKPSELFTLRDVKGAQ